MDETESEADLFGRLDNLIKKDAYTSSMVVRAEDIEKLIVESDLTFDELAKLKILDLINEKVALMNNDCPHLNQPVNVSGKVKHSYYDDILEEFCIEDVEVQDSELISQGYTILGYEDETGQLVKKVGHLFLDEEMEPRNDGHGLVDYVTRLFAFAPVGTVEIDYYSDDEETIRKLQQVIPEIIEEIDFLVSSSDDECEALLSLSMHSFLERQDIPKKIMSKLVDYVYHRLNFDNHLPYLAAISGLVYDDSTGDRFISYRPEKDDGSVSCVLVPQMLSLRQYPDTDSNDKPYLSDEFFWCLDALVIDADPDSPGKQVSVPVRNFQNIQSVRSVLFVEQ